MYCPQAGSGGGASAAAAAGIPNSIVNKSIQQLAVKYCTECKSSFDELSKIIQVKCITYWIYVNLDVILKQL